MRLQPGVCARRRGGARRRLGRCRRVLPASDAGRSRPRGYKIAYERATFAAAAQHADRARRAEEEGRLDEALREYRRASELDSSNRQVAAKVGEIERTLRDRLEASRPKPPIERLREEARKVQPEPLLSPTSPLGPVRFDNANARDVLNFIGESTGINVLFDREFADRTITINVEGVTLEEALQQIMITNQMFYKVLNDHTILVAQDTTAKRNQYEDQVVRTFFLSHADATEMQQLLITIIRIAGMAVQPQFVANKTTNTLTARASTAVMAIIERMLEANDKPRAEIIIDVQILEVSRERAKLYGLNLSQYAIGGVFSPETRPADGATAATFNLNTISQGVSTADFYMAVPAAVLNFLETDSRTKVLAKPQLRGTEGQKVQLNLGEDVPIPSTTFTPLATGGAAANPLTSFGYRTIGIIVEMTPRVTYEGEVVLDLSVENSARGTDVVIAGQSLPAFLSRKVTTRLRLRDGEPNLLAGLLREDERKSLSGFPGLLRMPVIQSLFGNNDMAVRQTDIVMLLTPRIVRTHELTADGSRADLYRTAEQLLARWRSAAADQRAARRRAAGRHRRDARAASCAHAADSGRQFAGAWHDAPADAGTNPCAADGTARRSLRRRPSRRP